MPTQFQFTKKNGEIQTLQQIDREICEFFGCPCSETTYSPVYDLVVMAGIACLTNTKKSEIDGPTLEEYLSKKSDFISEHKVMLTKFLTEDYTFSAWYQPWK